MSVIPQSRLTIARLRAELPGQVITPADERYDEARAVFPSAVDRRPAAIVRPVDVTEVAHVVWVARESGLELAVRSGGHSLAGHGVSQGGIVLDLSRLKQLSIDPVRRLAWAETGLTTGEATAALGAHGLAIGFGDSASVGIGGLTLGGGVGFLARKHGLTVDSVVAAELVTAEGRLLRLDADRHPDLFWAIRGGGGNFGVVTRFRYRLHPVDTVVAGMVVLPATPETIAGFVAAAEAAPDELSTIASVLPAPPLPFLPEEHHGRLVLAATVVHAGSSDAAEPELAPFRALATPIVDLLRPMRYPELFAHDDAVNCLVGAARTMFLDRVGLDVAQTILERLRTSTAQMPVVQLRVLGGAVARVPVDATAYAHRRSRIMANVAAYSAKPDEAPLHASWTDDTVVALRQDDDGADVNFLGDEGHARVRAAYPGATWDRLAAVKHRYDPENLFRLNQNVPPAAPAVEEAA